MTAIEGVNETSKSERCPKETHIWATACVRQTGRWGMRVVMVWLCLRVWARVRDSARQLAEQQEGLLIPADR